jgi:peptidoglycan/LPS O-acetylase OafA/YrhL
MQHNSIITPINIMEKAPPISNETVQPEIDYKPTTKRRPQLDVFTGLRGVASLWVFLFHRAVKSETEVDLLHLEWIGITGQAGVSLFFCLSGFIMVWVYGNCTFKSSACYWSFIGRRMARLLPLYYFSMLLSIYDARCLWSSDKPCTALDWVAILLTIIPVRSWTIFAISDLLWNPVLWSVQTELFFYIVFPVALRFIFYFLKINSISLLSEESYKKKMIPRFCLLWILVSCVSAIPLVVRLVANDHVDVPILYRGQTVAYYTPYARLPEFILGIITGIIYISYSSNKNYEPPDVGATTPLIPGHEIQQHNGFSSWFEKFRSNYKYPYILLDIYCLCQVCFFGIIHSPILSRTKDFSKYDDIIIYGPVIGLIMCSNLYFYAKYTASLTSTLLVTSLIINMGDISYAFYCLVEALPKISVLALGDVELSATMRLWSGLGIAVFAHHYIEMPVYSWVNKKLAKCKC